ncbi:TetR/AcrR family transcriptional regulator [Larkinella punicea]|uniref:TetR/AcrR family transcriptional regulator n=1 Tax=Larkinella punicea TaxID=2315727 RepID=A0A368JSW7_9BACT|nr:TetR/AcrR family transcriptional regulator [Larkinella punicea]RCR70056.1 TetR/AcrR family transcriptional regulator [Larkinella punicea]
MLTKAERTKQFILETAAPLFNERGVAGVHIDDVLAATKVAKGCLYGHFENKEDLSVQVIDLLLSKMTEKILTTIGQADTAKAKIFAFLDLYTDPLNTYIRGGCPIFNMAVESDDTHPIIKKKVAAVITRGQEMAVAILKQGIENGEFSTKLDPVVYAFHMVAAVEGGVIMCRAMNTAQPMISLIKSLKAELERYAL